MLLTVTMSAKLVLSGATDVKSLLMLGERCDLTSLTYVLEFLVSMSRKLVLSGATDAKSSAVGLKGAILFQRAPLRFAWTPRISLFQVGGFRGFLGLHCALVVSPLTMSMSCGSCVGFGGNGRKESSGGPEAYPQSDCRSP
jgi:hypothetical protein